MVARNLAMVVVRVQIPSPALGLGWTVMDCKVSVSQGSAGKPKAIIGFVELRPT